MQREALYGIIKNDIYNQVFKYYTDKGK